MKKRGTGLLTAAAIAAAGVIVMGTGKNVYADEAAAQDDQSGKAAASESRQKTTAPATIGEAEQNYSDAKKKSEEAEARKGRAAARAAR